MKACQYILHNDQIAKGAKDYLNGRLDEDAQYRYELGYFPANHDLGFLTSILDKNILCDLMLVYPKFVSGGTVEHGHFNHHNLIIPFRDVHGNIVALLGRSTLPDEQQKELRLQKYKYSYGSNKDLYVFGLHLAKEAIIQNNYAIVTEGQFDFFACREAGLANVVASGWANLTRYQFFQLHRYTNNVYLMMDNDEAGKKASKRVRQRYCQYANVRRIPSPENYKDIDLFLKSASDTERRKEIGWLNNLNQEI